MNVKDNLKKWLLFFTSKMGIFNIFFKRLRRKNFKDLEFDSNWKFQTRPALSDKKWPLKCFVKLHKGPILIASISKDAVLGLRQFLATESPWKIILFHLKNLNLLLANQIMFILCILIKLNVWYSWSLKIIKDGFRSTLQ